MNIRKLVFIIVTYPCSSVHVLLYTDADFFCKNFLSTIFSALWDTGMSKNRDAGDVPVLQFLLMYDISQKCIGNNIHNDCCHNDPSQDGNGGFFNIDFQK